MHQYYSLGNFTLIKMDLWLLIQLVNEKKDFSRYLAAAEFRASPPTFLATIYCLISETFWAAKKRVNQFANY